MCTFLILGVGTQELLLILLVALLLFGGKKIPELMKGLGKGVKSFRDGMNGLDEADKKIRSNHDAESFDACRAGRCLRHDMGRTGGRYVAQVFRSPFDFPILLSANFGELRPNHFHNGLDIKTQGVTGKPIHCIADGYVSRVAVLHGGYGQAIYITHPNGLTSVYGHVVAFSPEVERYVRDYQYANETFVCNLFPEPDVSGEEGDVIA